MAENMKYYKEQGPDSSEFFAEQAAEYAKGYKVYNELLANIETVKRLGEVSKTDRVDVFSYRKGGYKYRVDFGEDRRFGKTFILVSKMKGKKLLTGINFQLMSRIKNNPEFSISLSVGSPVRNKKEVSGYAGVDGAHGVEGYRVEAENADLIYKIFNEVINPAFKQQIARLQSRIDGKSGSGAGSGKRKPRVDLGKVVEPKATESLDNQPKRIARGMDDLPIVF